MSLFLFENIVMTWTKTNLMSLHPLHFEGYFLSVNFVLDIVVILSLFLPVYFHESFFTKSDVRSGIIVRTVRWYGKFVMLYRNFRAGLERFSRDDMNVPIIMEVVSHSSGRGRAIETPKISSTNGSILNEVNYTRLEHNQHQHSNKQSKLGSQLTNAITVKVVVITLVMLLILPLTFYYVDNSGPYDYTYWLHTVQTDLTMSYASKISFLNQYVLDMQSQPEYFDLISSPDTYYLLQLQVTPLVNNSYVTNYPSVIDELRDSALHTVQFVTKINETTYNTKAVFSLNSYLQTLALFNLILTLAVCVLLVGK